MLKLLIFIAPYLFFQMELIAANALLPTFGGSAYVWVSCVLFYTLVSFLGYLLVNLFLSRYGLKKIKYFYLSLVSLSFLNILFIDFKIENLNNSIYLYKFLFSFLFLPLISLAMATPLFQAFYKVQNKLIDPTQLISFSNLGSLIGLLSYPFLINIYIDIPTQILMWKIIFFFYLVMIIFIKIKDSQIQEKIKFVIFPKIIYASIVSTCLMLSVTNFISLGLGSLPIIWTIPLAIFLLSFILNFKNNPIYSDKRNNILLIIWLIMYLSWFSLAGKNNLIVFSIAHYLFLFIACNILARYIFVNRSTQLDMIVAYNVSINLGGLIGSVVVLFFPLIVSTDLLYFSDDFIVSIFFLLIFFIIRDFEKLKLKPIKSLLFLMIIISTVLLSSLKTKKNIANYRNFYGLNRILEDNNGIHLMNGLTIHGIQYKNGDLKGLPLSYYHINSPISEIFKLFNSKKTALIGLGAGSLAYYGQKNDEFDFYEIDPNIIKIANDHFTYLEKSKAKTTTIVGDGRIKISQANKKYNLIVIDAFSNNYVPIHLLTDEAINIYLSKLEQNGIISFHISSTLLKLEKVLSNVANKHNKKVFVKKYDTNKEFYHSSKWAIIVDKDTNLKKFIEKDWIEIFPNIDQEAWTDNKKNIFNVIF